MIGSVPPWQPWRLRNLLSLVICDPESPWLILDVTESERDAGPMQQAAGAGATWVVGSGGGVNGGAAGIAAGIGGGVGGASRIGAAGSDDGRGGRGNAGLLHNIVIADEAKQMRMNEEVLNAAIKQIKNHRLTILP